MRNIAEIAIIELDWIRNNIECGQMLGTRDRHDDVDDHDDGVGSDDDETVCVCACVRMRALCLWPEKSRIGKAMCAVI